MYSPFINSDHISPLYSTIPAMFAKSSFVWSTIMFIFSNNQIKSKINKSLFSSQKAFNTAQCSTRLNDQTFRNDSKFFKIVLFMMNIYS